MGNNAREGVGEEAGPGWRERRSSLVLGCCLLLLTAGIAFLAGFLPFSSYYIPEGSISPATIFLVLAGFSLLILGIFVSTLKKSYTRASLALILLVSLTATLASSSHTIALNYGSFCRPGVLSRGFPFPWIVRPTYSQLGFGFVTTGCPFLARGTRLVSFTPLFFALDTIFYFAASLAISLFYRGLVKPVVDRLTAKDWLRLRA